MEKGGEPDGGHSRPSGTEVDVRIAAKGADGDEAGRLIAPVEAEIRRRLERRGVPGGFGHPQPDRAAWPRRAARVAATELGGAGTPVTDRLATGWARASQPA